MALKVSAALRNAMLVTDSFKALMDGCFIYIFAGPIPDNPEDALDMDTTTQLVKITGPSGAVLNFASTASNGVLSKNTDVWDGLIDFDGAVAGPGTLTATFFRMTVGEDGRSASSVAYRVQGTIGLDATYDYILSGTASLTDNGSNRRAMGVFQYWLPNP